MRKAKVTPSGTPASTKPMKSGTAEHEQNGVTIPRPAAPTVPTSSPRPTSGAAHLLGREEAPDERDDGDDAEQQQEHLGHVVEEERDGLAEVGAGLEAEEVEGEPGGERAPPTNQATSQATTARTDVEPERQAASTQGDGGHRRSSPSARAARRAGLLVPLVVDPPGVHAVPARAHESRVAEPGEVVADVVLALAEGRGHLADADGPVAEHPHDARPDRIGQKARRPLSLRSRRGPGGSSSGRRGPAAQSASDVSFGGAWTDAWSIREPTIGHGFITSRSVTSCDATT